MNGFLSLIVDKIESVYDMVDACPKDMLSNTLLLSDSFLLNIS